MKKKSLEGYNDFIHPVKMLENQLQKLSGKKVLVSREQGQFPDKSICWDPEPGPVPTRSTLPALLSVGVGHSAPNSLHPTASKNHLSISFYLCSCPSSFRFLGRNQGIQLAKFNMLRPWLSHLENGYTGIIAIS